MGEALFQEGLQRIVVGMRHSIFREDAVEDLCTVSGATTGQRIGASRIAVRGSVRTQSNQVDRSSGPWCAGDRTGRRNLIDRARNIRATGRGASNIRHVENLAWRENELILAVFTEWRTTLVKIRQIDAGLCVRRILIVNREQPVSLRSDIAYLNENVTRQFALDREVVLR